MKNYFMLNSRKLSDLEDIFFMYPDIDRLIAIRKSEIINAKPEYEIVGGRSNIPSNPTEQAVLSDMEMEVTDKFIIRHRMLQDAVRQTLEEMDDKTLAIVHERYYSGNGYDWDTIGQMQEPFMPHTTIYRKRKSILTHLAKNIGMI
ncbi:hypothetical protein [Jeotgalibaca porci]|uniref:hypothetical protein n=1 Tax=Jeotgalibaca porci TaxID=1868793 RepID=UPI00359F923F